MRTNKDDLFEYFDKFSIRNKSLVSQFLTRFPYHKSYLKKSVLDFGSGTGCLSFELIGSCGSIVGLEIDSMLHEYSVRRASSLPKRDLEKLKFINEKIENIKANSFDVIFSKDVFEHVEDPQYILKEMYRVLKPGGQTLVGFGPLWYSPFGDHGILKNSFGFSFPWLHVLIGKRNVVNAYNNSTISGDNKYSKRKIDKLENYLNLKTGEFFREMIHNSDFEIVWYEENVHENFFINLFKKKFTNGEYSKYFIRNIYCILKKN